MRRDAVGFFWNDAPVPKPPKPKPERRQPPERTWERPDYLPGLAEALEFDVPPITDMELMCEIGCELYFDIEVYPNFFQIGFMSKRTGHVLDFWMTPGHPLNHTRVKFICENFILKGFNSFNYDVPILSFALAGYDNAKLKHISDAIIIYDTSPRDLFKGYKVNRLKLNHVDLIEVAPGFSGLKAYGGRMHVPRMQDLPFNPGTVLSPEQMQIVRWYNVNDLVQTWALDHMLREQQELRISISNEIGQDLRSKSDAQIAEAVISHELHILTGIRARRPEIEVGTAYRYQTPGYLNFYSPQLQHALDVVQKALFVVDETGSVATPAELQGLQIPIGNGLYTMGIGGLHSTEKSRCVRASGGYKIYDVDVESYYPRVMLNLGICPQHLGTAFLDVFNRIVERRIHAKRTKNKVVAESLKITINGTFGKLGSMYSLFYAPDLLVQVTLTGQLSLLMLIELLESFGIEVLSGNTDGITVYVHESKVDIYRTLVKQWEQVTKFKIEEAEYVLLANKDVNNYIAIKPDGTFKGKGLYANPWHSSNKEQSKKLEKNPASSITVDAVIELLARGVSPEVTISSCTDFTKFVSVRHVSGGAVKDGVYLGKSVRWYHATGEQGEIISAKTGNKVPRTDGTKPCMQLPKQFPTDIDYGWYVKEADAILKAIGYLT